MTNPKRRKRRKLKLSIETGLPYGAGSLQMRHSRWWMIYRDADGRVIQENTRTQDPDAARQMLAARAVSTAKAKLNRLKAVIQ